MDDSPFFKSNTYEFEFPKNKEIFAATSGRQWPTALLR